MNSSTPNVNDTVTSEGVLCTVVTVNCRTADLKPRNDLTGLIQLIPLDRIKIVTRFLSPNDSF
jgi:hypothetical protein